MARRSDPAGADDSETDVTSPLLPHPATQSAGAATSTSSRRQQQRQHRSTTDDLENGDEPIAGEDARDDGETAYARLRWAVASLIIASFLAIVLWLAIGGGAVSEQDKCRNRDPGFPGEDQVGYEGPTPTGTEAMAAATSYPSYYDTSPISPPTDLDTEEFNILHYLGNLSPWRTVNFGLKSTAQVPEGCTVEQVQLLHRHGARYPTTGTGASRFAEEVVGAEGFKASGNLTFLNGWKNPLGLEILTPFGREQLFNLGVSFRTKYGALLKEGQRPVFRTESEDRMVKSALNFAAGFFGIPFEEQYHQLITIEAPRFNNTLAPYMTCPNANDGRLTDGHTKRRNWVRRYLDSALPRVQAQVEGVTLTHEHLFDMQLLCAYELVSLGGSSFCSIFTEDEWRGFEYAHDIEFFDSYSFGQPAQAAMGKGWAQEWLARTLQQSLSEFNTTTNSTLHSGTYFPLDQNIYVDATHDTVISAVIVALGFQSLTRSAPLPDDHIPKDLSYVASATTPFGANLHSQVLHCPATSLGKAGSSATKRYVRWILNDGVLPLDHIEGCVTNDEGICSLEAYTTWLRRDLQSIDWDRDCHGDYPKPAQPIKDGRPPAST
ncbi:hypothetical protein JCM10908_007034 [Rhodotorula pacifica]|uniref:histidine phosphatase family protein n=1 Tax=Rhodotorula pacifica TaxID=1495444 RepID=UPI003178A08F